MSNLWPVRTGPWFVGEAGGGRSDENVLNVNVPGRIVHSIDPDSDTDTDPDSQIEVVRK
jgi:hypothetical protein